MSESLRETSHPADFSAFAGSSTTKPKRNAKVAPIPATGPAMPVPPMPTTNPASVPPKDQPLICVDDEIPVDLGALEDITCACEDAARLVKAVRVQLMKKGEKAMARVLLRAFAHVREAAQGLGEVMSVEVNV